MSHTTHERIASHVVPLPSVYGSRFHTRITEALDIYTHLISTKTPESKYGTVLAYNMQITKATAESYLWVCKKCSAPLLVDVDPPTSITKMATPQTHSRQSTGGNKSKMQLATEIYKNSADKSRQTLIARFVTEIGMTFAGAQTYFYTIKKSNL